MKKRKTLKTQLGNPRNLMIKKYSDLDMNVWMRVFFFLCVLFFTKVCLFVCRFLIGGTCRQQDAHQSF